MNLDVLFLPAELAARQRPQRVAAVVDVIRATTTIVTAFEHGCGSIRPVAGVDEARQARAVSPAAILAGEQGGKRLPGFDMGNSPREFMAGRAAGRDVILNTSNGTKALRAIGAGRRVAIAAFLNRTAVADWLVRQATDALILCSGYEGIFSLEDAVCAGGVADRAAAQDPALVLGDGALACRLLWGRYRSDLPGLLPNTGWGKHIVAIGLGADLEICARLDVTDAVPVMADGLIRLESR
ncbi:MAG: 2-phosphosulfolactate phosphatase [candidate division NC10 bacterium]|nr:2-phosphosulfolactate phosphatase [candidate division NC10 bacterium]